MANQLLGVTFKQLRVFVLIAEQGTFSGAAEQLGIAQPSISRHVKALEARCGPLFIRRSGGRVSLSPAGEMLYRRAPELLRNLSDIGVDLGRGESLDPIVRIVAGEYFHGLLKEAVAEFLVQNPTYRIETGVVATEKEGLHALDRNEADLFYITKLAGEGGGAARAVGQASASLFATPALIGALQMEGPGAVLPLIMPPAGSPGEQFVIQALHAAGVTSFRPAVRGQHIQTCFALALRGVGVAVLSDELVRREQAADKLGRLDLPPVQLSRWCFVNPHARNQNASEAFCHFSADFFRAPMP